VEFQVQVSGHEVTEKVGRIQAASFRLVGRRQIRNGLTHPTLTRLLVEWAARARVLERRMVAKADTPSGVVQAMCTVQGRQGVWQDFRNMQLGRGTKCLACKERCQKNKNNSHSVSGTIFTNADLKYAGKFDDKQDGDTIVRMERVKEATTFNVELMNESTCLWLILDQMGFPLRQEGREEHEERAEDSDSIERARIWKIHCNSYVVSFLHNISSFLHHIS